MSEPTRKPKRIDMRTGMHRKKKPEELLTPEQVAEIQRRNAEIGAKQDGSHNLGISAAQRKAIKILNEAEKAAIEARHRETQPVREEIAELHRKNKADRAYVHHLNTTKAVAAASKLGELGFRVRGDIRGDGGRDAAKDLGGMALSQMTLAMMGRFSKDKINAILKASIAMREEICDPLVKETRLTGALTLEQLVSQAAVKAKELKEKP
jgi:hypothetical protein